ncbi:MAG TPA: Error-prone repair protein ImuA [Chitinophagaceae bacterium]|nr:Error-prone repair protein ImuA [Chitinophagaceae bacterium]
MPANRADIFARLQRDILSLQGLKPLNNGLVQDMGLGPLNGAFPNKVFPLGVVHEFHCSSPESAAASIGFITGLLSTLMQKSQVAVWITSSRQVFPVALRSFGIEPDKVIFIEPKKEKDVLWVIEEALKCNDLAAVVGEVHELDFTASRRLQLAVEKSRVTAFILRRSQRKARVTASVARWKITSLPGIAADGLPGVGHPRWKVDLLKIRNGTPGSWEVQWVGGRFRFAPALTAIHIEQRRKTG